jgi:cell division protein FtsB
MKTDAGRAAATGRRAPKKSPGKRRPRASRSTILLRWCAIGALGFVAFLYYRPLTTYLETRNTLLERKAEVAELRAERERLTARLAHSTTLDAVAREARRELNLVRPGERLFVVRGVAEWRRAHRATIDGDG